MEYDGEPISVSGEPTVYQIRVKGHLSEQWTDWLEGFTLNRDECGDSIFVGEVVDQAALYGVIRKIRNIGITLVSVNRIESVKNQEERI